MEFIKSNSSSSSSALQNSGEYIQKLTGLHRVFGLIFEWKKIRLCTGFRPKVLGLQIKKRGLQKFFPYRLDSVKKSRLEMMEILSK